MNPDIKLCPTCYTMKRFDGDMCVRCEGEQTKQPVGKIEKIDTSATWNKIMAFSPDRLSGFEGSVIVCLDEVDKKINEIIDWINKHEDHKE